MDEHGLDTLERLFHEALKIAPEHRESFLKNACDDHDQVFALQRLLEAHQMAQNEDFLASGPPQTETPQKHRLIGSTVGPYHIERFLGAGGMGDVFLAIRKQPFKLLVGLKILRPGSVSEDVIARFDVERQILASLNHPHIGKLLDGGVTDEGLPFFAMEFVDGMPVTKYCDSHGLSVDERVRLFLHICDAVSYAHQNLVIHRDLKPPNILVTSTGKPKLLDFGIAKILNPNLADLATPITQTQFRMMTPDYASPEQIRGDPLTTATDIYSLGVILYEMLAGCKPFDLGNKSPGEIERIVCTTEPARPSTVEVMDDAGRRIPNRKLAPGDLDNITLMALRKEPQRRYSSVDQFAQDLRNYLAGMPVQAHADSRGYRMTKFVQRHKLQVGFAAVIAAMLIGFAVYNQVQAKKLERERDRATTAAAQAEQVKDFVVRLVAGADPSLSQGEIVTVRDLLDSGVQQVEQRLADQPAIQAELFSVMGQAYQNLGQSDRAYEVMSKSVELFRNSGTTLQLANVLAYQGEIAVYANEAEAGIEALEESVDKYAEATGAESPTTLLGKMRLYSHSHMTEPGVIDSVKAVWPRLEARLGEMNEDETVFALDYMTQFFFTSRRFEEAEAVGEKTLGAYRQLYGELSQPYGGTLNTLGWIKYELGDFGEAIELARESIPINEKLHPDGHRDVAYAYGLLGNALAKSGGSSEEARLALEKDLNMSTALFGEVHVTTARAHRMMGRFEKNQENYASALEHYQRAAFVLRSLFGADYIFARTEELEVGTLLMILGRTQEARNLFEDLYAYFLDKRGAENQYTLYAREQLESLN